MLRSGMPRLSSRQQRSVIADRAQSISNASPSVSPQSISDASPPVPPQSISDVFIPPILTTSGEVPPTTTNASNDDAVSRPLFGCKYCNFQSGLCAVATANHHNHERHCTRYVVDRKCAQCVKPLTGSVTKCNLCRRDVHAAARCSDAQGNCHYCVRWLSSPLVTTIAPGELEFDNKRITKNLIRSHCDHMGLTKLASSVDRRMLWCHAFKDQSVPTPPKTVSKKNHLVNSWKTDIRLTGRNTGTNMC